jgi:hypothetical protein
MFFSEVDLMRHKKTTFISIFDVILQDSAKKGTFFDLNVFQISAFMISIAR